MTDRSYVMGRKVDPAALAPGDVTVLLTAAEAAVEMRCHERTVRRSIGRGELPARLVAGRWMITASELPTRKSISLPGDALKPLPRMCPWEDFIYFLRHIQTGMVKIGISGDPWRRAGSLERMGIIEEQEVEVIAVTPGDREAEQAYHRRFRHLNSTAPDGLAGFTEWFLPGECLLAFVAGLPDVQPEDAVRMRLLSRSELA